MAKKKSTNRRQTHIEGTEPVRNAALDKLIRAWREDVATRMDATAEEVGSKEKVDEKMKELDIARYDVSHIEEFEGKEVVREASEVSLKMRKKKKVKDGDAVESADGSPVTA